MKKGLVFWKRVGIILSHIKLGIFRLFISGKSLNTAEKIFLRCETKRSGRFVSLAHPLLSRLSLVAYFIFLFLFVFAARLAVDASPANGETITYTSASVWRADGAGDYTLPVLSANSTYISAQPILCFCHFDLVVLLHQPLGLGKDIRVIVH